MAEIPHALKAKMQADPKAPVDLIIRTKDDPAAHVAELQSLGWTVRHTFSLMPSAAIRGAASLLTALADKPWIFSIEEDRPVHTM